MQDVLDNYQDKIFALTRIVVCFLFLCHGAQKLFGEGGPGLVSLMGLAGVIELVGGLLIMFGLFTKWAAFICSGQMAVAYFMVHLPRGLLPINNGGELAALYSWVFLYIAARPAGIWSLENLRNR